jgi:transposase
MITKRLFEVALNINEPWYVKDIKFDSEAKRLDIHLDFKKGAEFYYESEEDKVKGKFKAYDTEEKQWRHLNFFEHECYLHARVPRVKIKDKKIRLIKPPWSGVSNGFTMLFEALVIELASHMPVHRVSKIIKESDYKIWTMLERYINTALANNDYSKIKAVGIDETSQRKGHKYITLFVDLNQRRTIFITEGKNQETVKRFRDDIIAHNGKAKNIKEISCDMSPAFIRGIKDYLANAEITFDRFHIMKILNKAVDTVRKQEVKTQNILKGHKYIFLKNELNLTDKQRQIRQELSITKLNLKSIKALHIRENFQEIYKAKSVKQFEGLLKKWYFWATHSRIESIKQAAYTIKRHWDGVIRWKISQVNNGLLEGLNSLIQAAKAKARGFRSFRFFRIIAFLVTGKLNFSQFNKYLLPT